MMNMTYNYRNLIEATQKSPTLSILGVGILIFSFILSIIILISFAKILKNNGKSGWIVLIPIYNNIALMQVAEVNTLWIILSFIPPFTIISIIKLYINLAKKYGKGTGYVIGLIFLPIIFIPLLAFSEMSKKTEEINDNNIGQSIQNLINGVNDNQSVQNTENMQTTPLVADGTFENVPIMPAIEEQQAPTFETQPVDQPVDQTPVVPAIEEQQAPIFETQPVDQPVDQTPVVPAIEEQQVPIFETRPVDQPVDQTPVVPAIEEQQVPIFETQPINNTQISQTVNTSVEVEPTISNAFENSSIAPNDQTVQDEKIDVPLVTSFNEENVNVQPTIQNIDTNKKCCKSCGKEMPTIVSICPNCGKEN